MKPAENIFIREPAPLSFGILVLPQSNMLSLASCIDPMRAANRRAGRPLFNWQLFSPQGGEVALTSGIGIATTKLNARPDFDALILVAGFNLTELATPSFCACCAISRRECGRLAGSMAGAGFWPAAVC